MEGESLGGPLTQDEAVHRRHGGALANEGQADRAEPLIVALRGDAYGGPVGLAVYYLARGEIEQAVEWAGKAVEQRFPAIIRV